MLECVCGGCVASLVWVGEGEGAGGRRGKKGRLGEGEGGLEGGEGKVIGGTLHHKCFC